MNVSFSKLFVIYACVAFRLLAGEFCEDTQCAKNGEVNIYEDLQGLEQDDPKLIQALKERVLIAPNPKAKLNMTKPLTQKFLRGQYGQPLEIEEVLKERKFWKKISKKKSGFFIEAGACNGESISNTLYFEVKFGWTGLLVEPNPDFLPNLKWKHRNAWILPHCLSTRKVVETVELSKKEKFYLLIWGDKLSEMRDLLMKELLRC